MTNLLRIKLLNRINDMSQNKNIIFCWVLSYIDIQGNDRTGQRKQRNRWETKTIKYQNTQTIKKTINKYMVKRWQELWASCSSNKLHKIKPTTWMSQRYTLSRKELMILTRVHIEHTSITHWHLLQWVEESPNVHANVRKCT